VGWEVLGRSGMGGILNFGLKFEIHGWRVVACGGQIYKIGGGPGWVAGGFLRLTSSVEIRSTHLICSLHRQDEIQRCYHAVGVGGCRGAL